MMIGQHDVKTLPIRPTLRLVSSCTQHPWRRCNSCACRPRGRKTLQNPPTTVVAVRRLRFLPQVLCMSQLRAGFPRKIRSGRQLGSCFAFRLEATGTAAPLTPDPRLLTPGPGGLRNMHKRITLWLALVAVASMGAEYRTANFVVTAANPQIAESVGKWAEHYRREKATQWLGREMPQWPQPCPLKVTVSMD